MMSIMIRKGIIKSRYKFMLLFSVYSDFIGQLGNIWKKINDFSIFQKLECFLFIFFH
ncbi:hypothetical protein [Erysipelotrichaceae bacterium 2_2_44A]|uniref:hypothetical protein n=1 Tax=Clostridium innocuum TaxID=1522 RepID=UPI0012F48B34